MLISVKMTRRIYIFFFARRCVTDSYAITKKERKKSLRVLAGGAKIEIMGPSGTPLIHLSVKMLFPPNYGYPWIKCFKTEKNVLTFKNARSKQDMLCYDASYVLSSSPYKPFCL